MKISLKWLNEFVEVSDFYARPEPLAEALTNAGLEVEDIEDRGKALQFVVTGLILDKQQHPNADKLSLCQVTTGEGVVHQIVCGAKNHKANDKVVVALPGAVLPGNFRIDRTVLRGVESGGMLCSRKELGLEGDSDGIMILPPETPIGLPIAQVLGLDDVTFELKVTPNRADCLSHFGLARELSCLLGRPLKRPQPKVHPNEKSTRERIGLEVRAADLCPRYAGRFISGVKVGPSPQWVKSRLESVGLKSINNVVDVTNLVMMELGQPLHAFDAAQIQGRKIIVDKSKSGEIFQTLDGTELKLTGDELMIRDAERAVALAGVVGGKNSGISEGTNEIFLESAYFSPASIRRTSRRFGLVTDSAYRFSRGVDPEGAALAMDRATERIVQLAGGEPWGDTHDFYPQPVKQEKISISLETISDRMGYPADEKLLKEWMGRLGCEIENPSPGEYLVTPPSFRFDLEMEMDLVEEYARLTGYNLIPEAFPPLKKEPGSLDPQWIAQTHVSRALRGMGFFQAINMAFTSEKGQENFVKSEEFFERAGFQSGGETVRLVNPLSEDINVMRKLLTYGLVKNAIHNFHQGQNHGALFEVGGCFDKLEGREGSPYREEARVSAIQWGHAHSLWNPAKEGFEVMSLKAGIEALFTAFGLGALEVRVPENKGEIPAFLHRGQAAWVYSGGQPVGFFGSLHPGLLDEYKIRVPMAVFELSMKPFLAAKPAFQHYRPFSRFPAVTRDLSLVMPSKLPSAEVVKEIYRAAGELLRSAEIFDLYADESLGKGQRSVAFRLTFKDPNGTLQDQVVQEKMDQILDSVKQKWGLSPRKT